MKRNYRFIKELIKLRLTRLMTFRLGFFGPFFVDGTLFLVQLMVFQAIYSNVERIGTWGRGEMIIFIGTFSLINALNMVIFFFGIISIPDKVRTGDFDLYVTKPVNPLLRITFEQVNPGSIPLIFMSVGIIAFGVKTGGFSLHLGNVVGYVFMIIIMTILWYDLEVLIRITSFYVISTANISKIEEIGLDLCMKIPGVVFKGVYKLLFYVILPYGIISTIPTQTLTGTITLWGMLYGIGIVGVFTIFTLYLWKISLKHYNSASS